MKGMSCCFLKWISSILLRLYLPWSAPNQWWNIFLTELIISHSLLESASYNIGDLFSSQLFNILTISSFSISNNSTNLFFFLKTQISYYFIPLPFFIHEDVDSTGLTHGKFPLMKLLLPVLIILILSHYYKLSF